MSVGVGILWAVAVDNITRQPETIAPVTMIACGFWTGGRERVPFFFLSFSTVQLCVLQLQGGTHTLPSQSKGFNVNGHIHGGGSSVRTFPRVQQWRLDRRLVRFQKFRHCFVDEKIYKVLL